MFRLYFKQNLLAMKWNKIAQTAFVICGLCLALGANAQEDKTTGTSGILENQPFTWMETTDRWNFEKEFSYIFDTPGPNFTAKGSNEDAEKFATRGPVLNRFCFGVEDPAQCTKDYIQTNLQNRYHPSIIYPVAYGGVEYVVFDLDENGKVVGGYHVVQQGTVCEPCSQAAVNEVAKFESDWSPALKNGNTAKSTVVVPVGFHVTAPLQDDDK